MIPLKNPLGLLSISLRVLSRDKTYVSGSISANQTSPPAYLTQFADAANVIGVVITRSPCFNPNAKTAKCNPEVALLTATAYFEPTYWANFSSNSFTLGPCVR